MLGRATKEVIKELVMTPGNLDTRLGNLKELRQTPAPFLLQVEEVYFEAVYFGATKG